MKEISELKVREPRLFHFDLKLSNEQREKYISILSLEELEKFRRFRFQKHADAYMAGKGVTRMLLSTYFHVSPSEVSFGIGQYQKPFIHRPSSELEFNLSHSGNLGLLGFSLKTPIGVDIEEVKYTSSLDEVAKRFFSQNEVNKYNKLEDTLRPQSFFNCWTRKEAFIKAIGHGLSFPLNEFEVSLSPHEGTELLVTHFDLEEKKKWSLESIDLGIDNYKAAFAIREEISGYKLFDFQHKNVIWPA